MENSIKISPLGFREYDARWLYEKDINLNGIENLGKGLGTQIKNHTKNKKQLKLKSSCPVTHSLYSLLTLGLVNFSPHGELVEP